MDDDISRLGGYTGAFFSSTPELEPARIRAVQNTTINWICYAYVSMTNAFLLYACSLKAVDIENRIEKKKKKHIIIVFSIFFFFLLFLLAYSYIIISCLVSRDSPTIAKISQPAVVVIITNLSFQFYSVML